jgi:hypothetical protein
VAKLSYRFQIKNRHLTPELTRRESTASCDKLTMKGTLIPVGLNELLGRPHDMGIQCAIWLCSSSLDSIQLSLNA